MKSISMMLIKVGIHTGSPLISLTYFFQTLSITIEYETRISNKAGNNINFEDRKNIPVKVHRNWAERTGY